MSRVRKILCPDCYGDGMRVTNRHLREAEHCRYCDGRGWR
jgi:DnaJ-class molecular chaperone